MLSLNSNTRFLAALAATGLMLAACTPSTPPKDAPASTDEADSTALVNEAAAGPHAAPDRTPAPRNITDNDAKTTRRVALDFGNTTAGDFAAPKRGTIVLPTQGTDASPIIILSHLRAPNCQDRTFTYPCPEGVEEFRYDEGMVYLGDHLAEAGYTVVIPDLGAAYIGGDLQEPYSQTGMWEDIVGTMLDALRTDYAGQTAILGTEITRPIDFENIGLFAHSRSGQLIGSAAKVAGEGRLKGVFAYGPAYDTVELDYISPALPDVPYLAVVGALDSDVGPSANLLLGHYATTPRKTAASVAEVPGLGHMYINRAASSASFDDRIGCDMLDCPDAAAHEKLVSEVATQWFDTALRHAQTDLPLQASDALPTMLGGQPARWLALTPNALGSVAAGDFTATSGGQASVCTYVDGMAPAKTDTPCPEPEGGAVQILTPVALIAGGAAASTDVAEAKGISLHVSPTGTYEGTAGTPVKVTLALAGGDVHVVEVPGNHPALASRKSDSDDGTYRLGTVRLPLEDLREGAVIRSVMIEPNGHPIVVRSVDFWK